uniref:hypothetical protein n=1 Tax=Paractinoplanes polyasparticus TaxID=2856853 RepID=UPI001C85C506|nr:hypothetical protein [Actinoplanes polyasparticus]
MALRKVWGLLMAVLTVVAGSLVVAAGPAQAHPIYRRAFGNQYFHQCLWAVPVSSNEYNYVDSCGRVPNTAAKWKLHVVNDNWAGSGHELWVLESVQYPSQCLIADGSNQQTRLGTCNWVSENNYNTFEAFYDSASSSGGVYQMKSTTWWDHGSNYCLSVNANHVVTYGACNDRPRSFWAVSAAA